MSTKTTRRSRSPKPSNVVTVDFAKGRPLPGPQKAAGIRNDLIRHGLLQVAATLREINDRLGSVADLLAEKQG